MNTPKNIAIYMDHFTANVISYTNTARVTKHIKSGFSHFEKEKILQKGESHWHHKEQDWQNEFYRNLRHELLEYNHIVLFGATLAKTELSTILREDKKFANTTIVTKNTDKITKNQQIAFVNNYFYSNETSIF
ncbi:MAG: hypothetical protein ACRC6O_12465 [Flavobacterium sp.]